MELFKTGKYQKTIYDHWMHPIFNIRQRDRNFLEQFWCALAEMAKKRDIFTYLCKAKHKIVWSN